MARQKHKKTHVPADAPVNTSVQWVDDRPATVHLAERILDPDRSRPLALVTIDVGQRQPYVPVAELAARVQGRADIVVLSHNLTNTLTDRLGGSRLSAFNGACRVYPPGDAWTKDVRLSPLRMGDTPEHRARILELLVRDVDTLTSKPQSGLPYDAESAASVRMSPGISGVFRVESVA